METTVCSHNYDYLRGFCDFVCIITIRFCVLGVKKPSKSFKPLVSKKFYLDVKNNAVLLKVESKLKSLGAVSIET